LDTLTSSCRVFLNACKKIWGHLKRDSFGVADYCTTWPVAFSAVPNEPIMLSKSVGLQLLAVLRSSTMRALFAAGWSECSLTKHLVILREDRNQNVQMVRDDARLEATSTFRRLGPIRHEP
jgi:hypothetical protein